MKSAVLVTLASMLALGLASERGWAQPTSFTYQGELKQSGQNATGTFDMQFRLYDLPNGGTQIGSTQCADNVSVAAGRFTTSIDFGQQFVHYGAIPRTRSANGLGPDVCVERGVHAALAATAHRRASRRRCERRERPRRAGWFAESCGVCG